jgi:hypothetical protein
MLIVWTQTAAAAATPMGCLAQQAMHTQTNEEQVAPWLCKQASCKHLPAGASAQVARSSVSQLTPASFNRSKDPPAYASVQLSACHTQQRLKHCMYSLSTCRLSAAALHPY